MQSNEDTATADANRAAIEGFGDWSEEDAFDAGDLDADDGATRGGSSGTFLTDLADTLRNAGLSVNEQDGWRGRSRGSGGYNGGPIGIVIHHTASPRSSDGQRDVDFMLAAPGAAPLANLYLDRSGTWWVLAAGATNTNGRGGPWGPIPVDGANRRVIGIEAGNEGTGEPWPDVMQDSYVRGVAALADRYDIESDNVISHFEWAGHTKRAKIDPAGPSRFGTVNSAKSWDMNRFRAAVNDARANRGRLQPLLASPNEARSDIYVVQPGDAWWSIAEKTMGDPGATWESLADANGGKDRVLMAGQVLTIPGGAAEAGGLATKRVTAEFPGEAKRGMKGPIVLAWQEALIAHGIIADTTGNNDGDYGESLEKAVLELQQSWGWSNADGVAGSGTWKKLQSAG